jgi:hypothetical protein
LVAYRKKVVHPAPPRTELAWSPLPLRFPGSCQWQILYLWAENMHTASGIVVPVLGVGGAPEVDFVVQCERPGRSHGGEKSSDKDGELHGGRVILCVLEERKLVYGEDADDQRSGSLEGVGVLVFIPQASKENHGIVSAELRVRLVAICLPSITWTI